MNRKVFLTFIAQVILLGLIIWLFNKDFNQLSIQHSGERAVVAPIVAYKVVEHSRGSDTFSSTFQFNTSDGRKIIRDVSFPKAILDEIKNNRPIVVCYRSKNPSEFVFEKDSPDWWFWLLLIVAFHVIVIVFKSAQLESKQAQAKEDFNDIVKHLREK